MQATKCCKGYKLEGPLCVPEDKGVVNPCGNVTCKAVPRAQCVVFKKCGKEIALFMDQGSIVTECHNGGNTSNPLSCSGVCVQDPCLDAKCLAFNRSEVLCFVSGCDCQATWIHLSDRAEVDCLSGEVISKQEPSRKRRETCLE